MPTDDRIIIVGAGCFGVSTAYHLLQRGYTNVTIIDRSPVVPAPDAASNDLNRVVRSSYSDKFYTQLAREAIASWKNTEFWGDAYHESGVLVLGFSNEKESSTTYTDAAYLNDLKFGAKVDLLRGGPAVSSLFHLDVPLGPFKSSANYTGYINHDGGWANAGKGLDRLITHVKNMGGKFVLGVGIEKLVEDGTVSGKIIGVEAEDGNVYHADVVVIATGSWTPSKFPQLELGGLCLATGQCLATIQLTAAEAAPYQGSPVVLDFESGFYVFPPNETNIIKFAIHGPGYTHTVEGDGQGISTPRTILSDPVGGLAIPKAALKDLRMRLGEVYPELAKREFTGTRLCWYNDTPDEDWVISHHPRLSNVIVATGGSGHAYKFLPVVGKLVADTVGGQISEEVKAKFSIARSLEKVLPSRDGLPVPLVVEDLATKDDWKS